MKKLNNKTIDTDFRFFNRRTAQFFWGSCLSLGWLILGAQIGSAETVRLSALDLTPLRQGWGQPQVNRSIREQPLAVGDRVFAHGVGTHAPSRLWLDLGSKTLKFHAWVGLDAAANGPGSIEFEVYADGHKVWESGVMTPKTQARELDVDLTGVQSLLLRVKDGGDGIAYDHANWAEAVFEFRDRQPKTVRGPQEKAVILTPRPGPAPQINGPSIYGCRPGRAFVYRIPATGQRPIQFAAENLPDSLRLDAQKGILNGTAPARATYEIILKAANDHGQTERTLRIVSGDQIALTPPMGWNHWYAHYDRITDAMMREAADIMVRTGLADVGYQYVCIDDCWMNAPKNKDPLRVGPLRDEQGNIQPNRHFPDMKGLTDHIHGYGLKAGIYTSPGPLTCAGFSGSHGHEAQDARRFAEWGFDLLKYDWCSYGRIAGANRSREALQKPYRQMGSLLRELDRDIVLNLCQYGMGNVWEWGAEVGGHSWRTSGDLGFELDRVFEVALSNAEHREYSRPGSWNDPDYIQIGYIGDARTTGQPRPCPLTPNEQYAYMSLWCLMAAPLFYSGDLTRLDEFTLNVLGNAELIEVNQDPLGECGRVVDLGEETFAMIKSLADGSHAVGLFNRGEFATELKVAWSKLGITGPVQLRDLWRQKDLGKFPESFQSKIPRHGVVMLRAW